MTTQRVAAQKDAETIVEHTTCTSDRWQDPDLLRLIYSCETVGGRNYSRYCSPEFDRLAKEAYMTPFGERRISLYHQMQKLLLDDAVAVPFIGDNVHIGLRASVRDLWMNSLGLYPVFVDTWLDR